MSAARLVVEEGHLYDLTGGQARLPLDTPAWFAWLDQPSTTRFAYAVLDRVHGYINGVLTVRKEQRQRGGSYWIAYRRYGGRLHKVYVGRSSALTQARLQLIAQILQPDDGPS